MEFNKKIIVLIGGSGSGKSFYEKFLSKNGYEKLISHTTREIRIKDNEQNGVDYFFVTKEEFNKIEMLERTIVKNNFYGLSLKEFNSKTKNVVVVVEPNGAKQIIEKLGKDKVITILIDLPLEERKQNMLNRGDTIEFINNRLENEDFVGEFYKLNLEPNILIKKRLKDCNELINLINKFS